MALLTPVASGNQVKASDTNQFMAAVVAQSYLIGGTTPPTSSNLTLSYGAQEVVVNNGASAVYVNAASGNHLCAASQDTYFDLGYSSSAYSGTPNGAYTITGVANGATAPAVAANSIRLWKVVSNGSQITSVTLLAAPQAITGTQLQKGLRQTLPIVQATNQTALTATAWANYPDSAFVSQAVTTALNGNLLARLTGSVNWSAGSGTNSAIFFRLQIGASSYIYFGGFIAPAPGGTHATVAGMGTLTATQGLAPGAQSCTLQYQVQSGQTWSCAPVSSPTSDALALEIVEYA